MTDTVCSRCKEAPMVLVARKENFCANCFVKFLRGKQRKQMMSEKYKVKYGNKESIVTKVMLCLSLGKSSLSLLDMIISSFQEQASMHKGKQGYHLTCLVISQRGETSELQLKIQEITKAYELENLQVVFKILDIDSFIPSNESLTKLTCYRDFNTLSTEINNSNLSKLTVKDLLSLCPQRTTKEDLLDIIYHDLFIHSAIEEGCDSLLLAHSMTKLADNIISLTVKGRGAMINERLTDGVIPGTNVEVLHPLRDILQTEIDKYAEFTGVGKFALEETNNTANMMTKYKTVNELTRAYFENLDKDYSEVISTVVKIGTKLTKPDVNGTAISCRVCGETVYKDPQGWLTNITVTDGAPLTTDDERALLKMYEESKIEQDEQVGDLVDVCYGCLVSLGEVKAGLVWPQRDQGILNEYILTDDEQ